MAASGLLFHGTAKAHEPAPLPEGNAYVRSVLEGGPRSQDATINDYSYDVAEMQERLEEAPIR